MTKQSNIIKQYYYIKKRLKAIIKRKQFSRTSFFITEAPPLFKLPRLAAKNSDPPTPYLLARRGASQKIFSKVFLFYLINIFLSFKQLYYDNPIELKHVSANGAK